MRIGLAQIDVKLGDVETNLNRVRAAIGRAAADGADLVVAPELCLSGYAVGAVDAPLALAAHDPALTALGGAPGGCAVAVGFPELGPASRVYNSVSFIDEGVVQHVHRKLYLPTYHGWEERKHFSAGTAMRAFDTRFGRAALLVCNDAWQPALAFVAIQDGAELLLVPANSSHGDSPELDVRAYWRDITRLYARLFECYVVFVNRVGEERGAQFWGGSHIVDPLGEMVCEGPEDDEWVAVTPKLDLAVVRERRRRMPLNRDARLAMLRRELTRLIDEGGDL
ncbi:MAG TPA: nitrilase-related carbon-nitrogen hydrolase [Solirubrobacteraceae bacterium]|jgi:predicted amidohydrolase